jgi:hypothetical protein
MLADGCEAAVRANRPGSPDQLNEIVRKVINDRVAWNQLDECPLTVADLNLVRESFAATLQGLYHPRLRYPGQEQSTEPAARVSRTNSVEPSRASDEPKEKENHGETETKPGEESPAHPD